MDNRGSRPHEGGSSASHATGIAGAQVVGFARRAAGQPVPCPRCGSTHTTQTSPFGSTACKALYRCLDCLEPFDLFKPY